MSMFLSAMFWNGIKKCEAKLPAIHFVHMVDWMELNFWLEINLFPCLETKVWQTFTVWSVNKVNIVIIFGLMTKFSAEDEQLHWGYSVSLNYNKYIYVYIQHYYEYLMVTDLYFYHDAWMW